MKTIGQVIYEAGVTGYQQKDATKFSKCNKLISRGPGSSGYYARICKGQCNTGEYTETDVVGISVNGQRAGRLPVDRAEVLEAAKAGVTFITDTPYHRSRAYNIGERDVAMLLVSLGYEEIHPGKWRPAQ